MATTRKARAKSSKASPASEAPTVAFADARAWTKWLAAHHGDSRGVWLRLAKAGSTVPSITYAEAVEGALIWGWIDGQKRSLDDEAWLQKFTPRVPKSIWSKINREKALALIAAGKMKAPGLAQVDRAKSDGRWKAAYDSPSRATVPADFAAALKTNARAAAFFETINAANRYAVLFRIHAAKRPETRAKRIEQFVAMLARHETLHP